MGVMTSNQIAREKEVRRKERKALSEVQSCKIGVIGFSEERDDSI